MATINGTTGNDSLLGTAEDDVINGLGGNDQIAGSGGDDVIDGGEGDDILYGDVGVGVTGPGLDATPITLNINNVRPGSDTAWGNNNAQPGDSAIYDNVATLDDGTQVYAKVTLVSVSRPGLNVDLTGGPGYEILINSGFGSGSSYGGETAEIKVEFYRADTNEPVALNSTATFNDLDRNSPGDQESVTVDGTSFSAFGTSSDTSLAVTQAGGNWTAAGTEPNSPSDQDAWFSAEFEAKTQITFTLETRTTPSGFTLSGDLIDDAVVTPIEPGNDTIFGGAGQDTIYGEEGEDILDGGAGDDTIYGGTGNDRITGGEGNDTLTGGEGSDTFHGIDWNDTVDGSEDPDGSDVDVLDLTGSAPTGGYVQVNYDSGNPENGTVDFIDVNGAVVGTMTFENIETVIPCFTPGTLIATPHGERRVEDLRAGDRVITRDNGIQEVRWAGAKRVDAKALRAAPHLRPVLVRAGSLGNRLPEHDMMVSPNHRILVANDRSALYFDEREVLASAKHLVDGQGVQRIETLGVTYVHFMFDHHEVVLSNGAWTESFQPGEMALKGVEGAARREILELFPELEVHGAGKDFAAARRTLKAHEARMLKG